MPTPGPTNCSWHRDVASNPLYRARRTPHTSVDLLTDKQKHRLADLFACGAYVEVTWGIYQQMIAAYRQPDRNSGGN